MICKGFTLYSNKSRRAFGNGGDFFPEQPYNADHVEFDGDMAKIAHWVYISSKMWDDGSMVIAKGMGNYETISEFDHERPVVYVLKVKCRTVAETLGREVGTYIAIAGGDHG